MRGVRTSFELGLDRVNVGLIVMIRCRPTAQKPDGLGAKLSLQIRSYRQKRRNFGEYNAGNTVFPDFSPPEAEYARISKVEGKRDVQSFSTNKTLKRLTYFDGKEIETLGGNIEGWRISHITPRAVISSNV